MLCTLAILWLLALCFTVYKRGRQIKKAKEVLQFNQKHYEQAIEKRQKAEKAKEESGDNTGGKSSD